ncbi:MULTISPECIES: carboxymuconolactone decarboxylase family protein [unclassified Pseudofrankia]|uniref:carboxymuconolactone decarboxylase family protein n=1 Tax=unclassified Pseudofrankia TaxID=2994372 RepID=UPI0008D8E559|nr:MULTISPECIES: carboxymuconolactone decarboxylase family protein [unclassified Pseudofrankia]MDT3442854.1 carboxymuconolactone decarboxylase family protein [Pseudofrankia sp. BMG5.37]OHV74310.1 carboxymuconolactone decarboxylase [Pseudofrankia sp. BMG5.36]
MTRLTPLPVEAWGDEARAVLPAYLRRPEVFASGERPMPNVLGLLARHLPLGNAWLAFNEVLARQTTLDPRLRELTVLRVAWRTRSAYEWAQHTRMGQQAGLTVEQVHAVPRGADAEVWSPVERAVLAAIDQLLDRHDVDDATWTELGGHLPATELLELLFVVGAYLCFAVVTNGAGLAPDPPTEPVDAPTLPAPHG